MNPAPASPQGPNDFGFSLARELDDRVRNGPVADWNLGALLELNLAAVRRDRSASPLFDDADLKIV